ncbi:hypothetical protein O6H91_02G099100 [Diphasiastrum complanatum]|nr:hypothetical protein O6H91_02G099100 [Diphasiastrum complanatum]
METPDWNKGVQGDKQAEANSGVVFQTMKIPQRTDVSRGQLIHDILKKDEQRLKYFASRVESAKSESSKTEPPKLNPLKVVKDESGESTEELEESSTSGIPDSN